MKFRTFLIILSISELFSQAAVLAQMPISRVVVAEAQMREAPSSITLVGTVNALRISKVSSEIAGIVQRMPVHEGDIIDQGSVLCKLNDDALSLRFAEEFATLESLQARHQELKAGTRKEELQRLKALLDEADADFERWKFEMVRIEKLYKDKDSNHKEYYDTRADYLTAERRRIAAQARYDEALAGPRKEVIAQAAHDVAAQQAIVHRYESDLNKTEIQAPFPGVITQRFTEVGEWISVGGQVVELADIHKMLVRVDAPESAFPYLVVGDPAHVFVDALRKTFKGKIKHIIPHADPNARTIPVEIEIDNEKRLLAVGMFARVTVTAGPKVKVVAIPKDAIVQKDGISYVAVVIPGQQGLAGILKAVTVGSDIHDWIAVTSGNIQSGMRIIIRGNERILPFPTPIQVVDDQGTPVALPGNGQSTPPTKTKKNLQG